ncbi:helix-turn-helix transcriptional regulator [Agrococcus beijingensis]|uniref:helix-turn-helix transcriptional regulator n=1 Tax=Agrococcus beijingensis TaxID=3068634 RepID=UPI00274179FD|nr:helix-turn-helix domain-containing protein [Agrococcus sp. REN33]
MNDIPVSGADPVRTDLFGYPPGVLLTERELAAAIHMSSKTLQHWRYTQQGPPFVRLGRHVRYRVSDVTEWIERNRG